jgi:prepilin-type N-terminal cleavage/methylation domain-containing protein
MHGREREMGFTLIELMIVVSIIAIIASIAIPNLLSARLTANEAAAIATLKSISSAQVQCQASAAIDCNSNGAGEYGYFGELCGAVGVRDASGSPTSERVTPPVLSGAFGNISSSRVTRSGFVFQMYLPSATATAVAEAPGGGVGSPAPDPEQAETLWCCYAWPSSRGGSGKRCFFVNQGGDVLSTNNNGATQLYSGTTNPPLPTAAFANGTSGVMSSTVAANQSGLDGGVWIVIN